MQLLVSVADAGEARRALVGGAAVIDAKNPRVGALGPVAVETLGAIRHTVGGVRPVSAAMGDAANERDVEAMAGELVAHGARLVKIGFAGTRDVGRVRVLLEAAVRGCDAVGHDRSGVVAVGYADADRAACAPPELVIEAAAACGARGVLVDTADKAGPGLTSLCRPGVLATWVSEAHDARLFAALAGKLTADDLGVVRDAGADVAGVRGAACIGGRLGRISASKVRALAEHALDLTNGTNGV